MSNEEESNKPEEPFPSSSASQNSESQIVPSLNKETWEYLEFRLWNSFSRKLWIIVTGFLTVVTILGVLGIDAWIKFHVDKTLTSEKQSFTEAKKAYEQVIEKQQTASAVLFVIQGRSNNDKLRYEKHLQSLREALKEEEWKALKSMDHIAGLLGSFPGANEKRDEFELALKAIKTTLSNEEKFSQIEAQLNELRQGAIHIAALEELIQYQKKVLFENSDIEVSSLSEYYENELFPKYIEAMKAKEGSTLSISTDSAHINTLWPEARSEFRFFVPSAFDKLD
jgi:hypothetical protein